MKNPIQRAVILLTLGLPWHAVFASSWPHLQSDATLHDVHFVDSQRAWAVGDRGTILHTMDGGRTWDPQSSTVDCVLRSVFFIDDKQGWVVGEQPLPYTQRGRGVVLRTDDGGRTWLKERIATLPSLRRVYFQTPKNGFAVGDGSPLFPSGAFFSTDGGRSWNPVSVQGLAGWVSACFLPDGGGLFLSPQGQIARCSGLNCSTSRTPLPQQRMRDIAVMDDQMAIAVGDQGTVWMSGDGGRSWLDFSRQLAKQVDCSHCDFASVACRGDSVWIAGMPGSKIFHSADAGRTWNIGWNDSPTPLKRLSFVDEKNGIAVGELGKIHLTSNGGQDWSTIRGAEHRLFALGIFRRSDQIPWLLWADLGGGRNARVHSLVLDVGTEVPLVTPTADRIHNAMVAVGGHGGDAWAKVDATRLVTAINSWQPDLIITDPLTSDQVMNLVSALPDRATRIWTIASDTAARERVSANELANPLGQSLGTLANAASSLIVDRFVVRPDAIGFQSLIGGGKISTGISPSKHNAREASLQVSSDRTVAQKQAALRMLIVKAAEATSTDGDAASWLAQVENLVAEMPQAAAAMTLYELAHLHAKAGDATAALTVLESLTAKYPDDPIAPAAVRDAIAWVTSVELRKYANQHVSSSPSSSASPNSPTADTKQLNPVQFASMNAEKDAEQIRRKRGLLRETIRSPQFSAGPELSLNDLVKVAGTDSNPVQNLSVADKAAALDSNRIDVWNMAIWKNRVTPMLKSDPKLQFAIEAHRRSTGNPGIRQRAVYQRLARASATMDYRKCGDQELHFLEPQRQSAKSSFDCRLVPKPHLDGKLDDATWQQAAFVSLKSRIPQSPPTKIWLARSEAFLYLAASCHRILPVSDPIQESRTGRDANLQSWDRLEFWLDVNRDYATAWHLAVDERGQVADQLRGIRGWDPRWFVAGAANEQTWTLEAAIPLHELSDAVSWDPWSIGIQRIIPGAVRMQWPADFRNESLASGGILAFP